MYACYRAVIERSRAYALDSRPSTNGVDGLSKPDAERKRPKTIFVTSSSTTSDVERRIIAERKLPVRSSRAYSDSMWPAGVVPPLGAVRRLSQPNPESENYGVAYKSPRADEQSADQPCTDGSAPAVQPVDNPGDAAVERSRPETDDGKAAAASTAEVTTSDAREINAGVRSLEISETLLNRSTSLRPSSSKNSKRRTTSSDVVDDDDVERVFVRRRAASFSGDRTSTRKQNDDKRQRHRRRMSSSSLLHPSDELQARTAAATPDVRGHQTAEMLGSGVVGGRADDKPGLPPRHRPASGDVGERRRRPPSAVYAAAVCMATSATVNESATKHRRRSDDQVSDDDKRRRTEDTGRHPHGSRQRHRREDDGDEKDDTNGHYRKPSGQRHHHHHRRSTSEHRGPSSDGEHRTAESTSGSTPNDIRHRHRHHRHRASSLDHSTPSADEQ